MNELMQELIKIQKTLKAPKNQRNTFGNYNFRSCEDIVEGVKPLLPEGISLILTDEMIQLGDRFYLKAVASFTNGTDSIKVTGWAREQADKKGMDEAQITGAASSYARKYALNGLLLIDDTKDADTTTNDELANLIEKAGKIKTLRELKGFYIAHKGKGKELDAAISKKKAELAKK